MKRILFIINIVLLSGVSLDAQSPSGRAYPNGIYIFCGKEIPRNFYYLIEKKGAADRWEAVAELRAPQNAAALKANMLNLPPAFLSDMQLPLDMSDYFWTKISKSFTVDSLLVYALDPKIMAAAGCGWFDDDLAQGQTFQYRISRVTLNETIPLGEVSQRFPENNYRGTLEILQFMPGDDAVTLYYGLTDSVSTAYTKLYRSRFLENDYSEVPASTAYTNLNGRTVAVISDESATKGIAYSYVAIPTDYLGNQGTPSDTLNVYNLASQTDIGSATALTAVGDMERQGVALSWEVKTDFFVQSYELYRSRNFDSGYERVATLSADVTSWFDEGVNPAESYFYFVIMNNGYGQSVPGVRVPVILEGAKYNILPPQNVVAELQGNLAQLSFSSIERDIRSYQIFRGEGYTGGMTLVATIDAADSVTVFVDTLELSATPQIYSYAVADVNSSNSVSPLSERVSIQYNGGMLPVPSSVDARLRDDGIFIVWDDMSQQNAFVTGYNLWRSTVDNDGAVEEEPQLVATLMYDQNGYTDSQITPGKHYRYVLESFDYNGEKSSQSQHVGVAVPMRLPLAPGQVTAIAATDRILLRWDVPDDPNIQNIRVYRATSGVQPVLLAERPADSETHEDQTAQKGEQYYYYVVTVNDRGQESKPDEPVSARLR